MLSVSLTQKVSLFQEDPEDFAFAASALLDPLGVGLIAGPLVGLAAMRLTNGNFTLVFVAAALGSLWQLLNCFRFDETLAPENRKKFQLRFADINPLSFIKCFTCGRPTLAKLTLISGCYQVAHEGKNTADVHQAIMLRDVGMSEAARSNFVSLAGVGLMINCRSNKFLLNKLSGRLFTSATNLFSLVTMLWFSSMPLYFRPAAWPMFVGLFVGCIGWSPYVWVRGQGAKHAVAAGIGNGETATRCVRSAGMAGVYSLPTG